MALAHGTTFLITNDIVQPLNPAIFTNGPWIHIATISRGFKEYMAFRKANENHVFVEEVDNTHPGLLKKIQNEAEWEDVIAFCMETGLLRVGVDSEKKLDHRFFVGN